MVHSVAFFTLFRLIPGLLFYPTFSHHWSKRCNDPDAPGTVAGIYIGIGLFTVLFFGLLYYLKGEGISMLYALALLAGTNFISGIHEIGRWYNKEKEEKKLSAFAVQYREREMLREEQESKVKQELKSRENIKSIKDLK